jgi:hypothetical protein
MNGKEKKCSERKHTGQVFNLDLFGILEDIGIAGFEHEPKKLLQKLRKYLRDLVSNRCPRCGGLLPELVFDYAGKKYFFTCYMVAEQGKGIIAETDYQTLHHYLCTRLPEDEKA